MTDERIKEILVIFGVPESVQVLAALRQVVSEVEKETKKHTAKSCAVLVGGWRPVLGRHPLLTGIDEDAFIEEKVFV